MIQKLSNRKATSCRLLVLVMILLFDFPAWGVPFTAPPRGQLDGEQEKPLLLARRRRRPRKKRPAPRPKVKPTPDIQEETPPESPRPAPAAADNPNPESLRRGGRVEFDGRLVQGQTAKSGAIYLFARQRTDLKSMVKERTSYRKEILRTVTSQWAKRR